MAFEPFFSIESLKPILENEQVTLIKFKFVEDTGSPLGYNIACTGCTHNYTQAEPRDIAPVPITPLVAKPSFWKRIFGKRNKKEVVPGTVVPLKGVVEPGATLSEVDQLFWNLYATGRDDPNRDPQYQYYDFVAFPVDAIRTGIFRDNLEIPDSAPPYSSPTIGLVVRHMLVDLGVVVGSGEKSCRKSISLYVQDKRLPVSINAAVLNPFDYNPTKVRLGDPCPPDWWYRYEPVIHPGSD